MNTPLGRPEEFFGLLFTLTIVIEYIGAQKLWGG